MYLLVYGTLKRGFHNHRLMEGAEYIGESNVPGYIMYSLGGFPGVVHGKGHITGELYKITKDHLPRLDRLEGFDEKLKPEYCMYLREKVRIMSEVGTWNAFIYVYSGKVDRNRLIEDGVWRR